MAFVWIALVADDKYVSHWWEESLFLLLVASCPKGGCCCGRPPPVRPPSCRLRSWSWCLLTSFESVHPSTIFIPTIAANMANSENDGTIMAFKMTLPTCKSIAKSMPLASLSLIVSLSMVWWCGMVMWIFRSCNYSEKTNYCHCSSYYNNNTCYNINSKDKVFSI